MTLSTYRPTQHDKKTYSGSLTVLKILFSFTAIDTEAHDCLKTRYNCSEGLFTSRIGYPGGNCLNENHGYRFGPGAYRSVYLDVKQNLY